MKQVSMEITGTTLGYEDYHGIVYDEQNQEVGHWSYDRNQRKYIAVMESKKRFYRNSVEGLRQAINEAVENQSMKE